MKRYLSDTVTELMFNQKYKRVTRHFRKSSRGSVISTAISEIFDEKDTKLAELKCLDDDGLCFNVINHSNGIDYLITRVDLYGYCVVNLRSCEVFEFIPLSSFLGKDELFIWTDVLYCKENNLLAVNGCYWASTFSTEVFDFSEPERLPYRRIFNSFDLENILNIDRDVTAIRWNEDGRIVLRCYPGREGTIEDEIVISIETSD